MFRPQLTTYSKAILLMHRNDYVCCRPKEDTISALEFYKYLLISRQFLRASQLYRVYQFAIFGYWQIALDLAGDQDNANNHSDIIRHIQKQLHSLKCDAESLIGSSDMPQLDLIDCMFSFDTLCQFKQVMAKHRIKKIVTSNFCVYPSPFYAIINDNFFNDFPTRPTVEKLNVACTNLSEDHDLVSKLTQMVPFFPNLNELKCRFGAMYCTAEQFSVQQLVVWIRKECKKIEKLEKACLSAPNIELFYDFQIRTPESKKIVKKLVKEILETTKFNQEHSANIITKPKDHNNYVLIKQHYDVELWRKQSNCHAILQFTIDIKPVISEDESTEDNDN